MNKDNRNILIAICIAIIIIIIILCFAYNMKNSSNNYTEETTIQETAADSTPNTSESTDLSSIDSYMYKQDEIMHQMMSDMTVTDTSGSADIDFLTEMIPHHQAAVNMAEAYLSYDPQSEEIKNLAENIISTQNKEIETMESLINIIEENGTADTEKEDAYIEAYTAMMQNSHSHNSYSCSSIDEAFAESMTEHHQMAVDMANLILTYGESQEVKALAQSIIDTQEAEILQMNNFLNK